MPVPPPKLPRVGVLLVRHLHLCSARLLAFLVTVTAFLLGPAAIAQDQPATPKTLTQKPAVAPSQHSVETNNNPAISSDQLFRNRPTAQWIWGQDNNIEYRLTRTFKVGALKAAKLRVSCDNAVTLRINDQPIGSVNDWQQPAEFDLLKQLREGENTLVADVANQGGISGFVCQLALADNSGNITYIISDADWSAAPIKKPNETVKARIVKPLGSEPWGDVLASINTSAIPNGTFLTLPDYQVELLFTVPKDQYGSWVCLTVDPKGRLLASDQGDKGLYRITPPKIGSNEETRVEKLELPISAAQGMLCAFDSLYLSVNGGPGSGLYRARDTNNDDQYDQVEKLLAFRGGGEHGPHALRLSPDGKKLVVICGNHTLPPFDPAKAVDNPEYTSRIPMNWNEDHILPRQWDANGHAVGILAPGGWIAQTDPDGKAWEILSMGYRNPYDMDFNQEGELFAYDADMEWDLGTPWYRPTRVVHATSGSEFGWRSGTGKWPTWYPDSLPPAVDIGPGSPVGVEFGFGAKFPAKYQQALYICDWTFGTMYAIHLQPEGSSYSATKEEFLSRTPLPLTDVTIGTDGAMYFTVGGRNTQSELYRVTYRGKTDTSPTPAAKDSFTAQRELRRRIEQLHALDAKTLQRDADKHVPMLLEQLGSNDRFIRYAARVALEKIPTEKWQQAILTSKNTQQLINGAIGLAHQANPSIRGALIDAMLTLDVAKLATPDQLAWYRAIELICLRLGEPSDAERAKLLAKLDPIYPVAERDATPKSDAAWVYDAGISDSDALNRELVNVLVYLRSQEVVHETIPLMTRPSKQGGGTMSDLLARNRGYGNAVAGMMKNQPDLQQLHYAFVLRNAKTGWTLDERRDYFAWFQRAHGWSGGASYQKFLVNITNDAYENATDTERLAVEAAGLRKAYEVPELPKPQGPGQLWTVDSVIKSAGTELKGRDFKNGQRAYAAARCVVCHRFGGEGGATGPDLTQLAGRFSLKDLTEAIVDPSRVISDQYRATQVATSAGQIHVGRLLAENDKEITLLIDPENSSKVLKIARDDIESMQPSKLSLMPAELLNTLNENEVLDLMAYLLSRGDAKHPMFGR